MKIPELESQIACASNAPLREILGKAGYTLPDHFQPQVSLLKFDSNGKKRQVRSDASADNWSPESGRIEIRFEPIQHQREQEKSETSRETNASSGESPTVSEDGPGSAGFLHPAEAELLRALDRAESKPGWNFVPLRKFRDEILSLERPEDIPHLRTDVEQRHMLQSAIDKRFVLVGKVPNPKAPQFPVTTIRLNRLMPQVKAALGQGDNTDLDFRPVEIRGEPLSTTILRERR